MATYIATADGNLGTAATWGLVDVTSLLDSEAGNTALTTSFVSSSVFTPGAITADGIAVKIATRASSPTGTISVRLFNSTLAAAVAGTTVTINVSDISRTELASNGWFLFKFAAPVLLIVATNYTVQATSSSAAQVNLFRDGTANNWARMLRTTSIIAAPGAGDNFFILGEWTAAASKTNRSVTMNSTAATDFGAASTTLAGVGISLGGTLTYGNTAATNYILRLSCLLTVWAGGIFTIPTMPRDSTAVLEFDCAADGDFGIANSWGTITLVGQSRTSGKNIISCLLNTDEAAAQTVLGVDTDTGWLSGDVVAIGSTTRTSTQAETAALSINATATELTITAGLTNAHGGSAATLVQAEVILLTRNVLVRSTLSTAMAYINCKASCVFTATWVDCRYIGHTTSGKRGIELEQTTAAGGSIAITFCGFRDTEQAAITLAGSTATLTVTSCTFWNCGTAGAVTINVLSGPTSAIVISDCVWIFGSTTASTGFFSSATAALASMTFTRCRCSSSAGNGIVLNGSTISNSPAIIDTCNFHCLAGASGAAVAVGSINGAIIRSSVFWRNTGAANGAGGVSLASASFDTLILNCVFFGQTTGGVGITTSSVTAALRGCTFAGDSTFPTQYGLVISNLPYRLDVENCTFGVATGILVAHTVADVGASSTGVGMTTLVFINSNLASATEFATAFLTALTGRSVIARQQKDGALNMHERVYPSLGTSAYATSVVHTAGPSQSLTPTAAPTQFRLQCSPRRARVGTGQVTTFTVWVRKTAAYTGSAPRLIVRANPSIGLNDDIVLDSLSVGADTWEQLAGVTTPVATENGVVEAYVDCDGTSGIVYVDDWAGSSA